MNSGWPIFFLPFQLQNLEWVSRYITPMIFLFLISTYHLLSKGWRWPDFGMTSIILGGYKVSLWVAGQDAQLKPLVLSVKKAILFLKRAGELFCLYINFAHLKLDPRVIKCVFFGYSQTRKVTNVIPYQLIAALPILMLGFWIDNVLSPWYCFI